MNISKKVLLSKIKSAEKFSRKLPSVLVRQLPVNEVAILQENVEIPRILFSKKSTRDYIIPIAPNVLGYTSETNQKEIKTKIDYDLGEMIGRQGIEKTYENYYVVKKAKNYFKKIDLTE